MLHSSLLVAPFADADSVDDRLLLIHSQLDPFLQPCGKNVFVSLFMSKHACTFGRCLMHIVSPLQLYRLD